ncbi:MAG: cytochrome-c oxidase, cbb3-type subunit III [Rhodospirillales bacterium]|nr:cytochrome-c oxidase, cbb3-type subunit III [Alphaproteobacteria bacterium]MBL6948019.1 cytochrome-c oxidase, cbb3-type subunit III [Rhodospirillales bacterium]
MAEQKDIDALSGIETTGHEWDGIRELDNPLPAWWLWIWYASIVWSIGYWIAYPAWPLVSSYTKGVLGYSSRAEVATEVSAAKQAQAGFRAKLETASMEQIRTQPDLLEFALAGGRSAFNVNCSQCHGSGAQGFAGYPNLNDDEWLWGGSLDNIRKTITHGVRNTDDEDARTSDMPAFLRDKLLTRPQVADVADYVLKLSGQTHDAPGAGRGAAIFAEQCQACHGETGAGDIEQGAPALNNAIWLYGGDKETIIETVSNSRGGVMPAWGKILDTVTVKQLAVYVHSLGGGR